MIRTSIAATTIMSRGIPAGIMPARRTNTGAPGTKAPAAHKNGPRGCSPPNKEGKSGPFLPSGHTLMADFLCRSGPSFPPGFRRISSEKHKKDLYFAHSLVH
jgi:hypothetical protein